MNKADTAVLNALDTTAAGKARNPRAAIVAVFAAFQAYAVAASKRGAFRVPGIVAGVVECDAALPARTTYRDDETATVERVHAACGDRLPAMRGDGARIARTVWAALAANCIARHDAGLPWNVPGVLNVAHATAETTDDAREAAYVEAERTAARRK